MKINFEKSGGLVPAVIQDVKTAKVLMLGYMNQESLEKTKRENKVTFYSRSRKQLWTKGETSGNFLLVKEILADCDADTLLIKAEPTGPVCHTGQDTCFNETNKQGLLFLNSLEQLINERKEKMPENSYTTELFQKGIRRIAQKVGEEANEVVIEAVAGDTERLKEETADLLYHLIVLLAENGLSLPDVCDVLENRHSGLRKKDK